MVFSDHLDGKRVKASTGSTYQTINASSQPSLAAMHAAAEGCRARQGHA